MQKEDLIATSALKNEKWGEILERYSFYVFWILL